MCCPETIAICLSKRIKPHCHGRILVGESPKTEIRHHGYYYPSCRGKCEPILRHMLQGLNVEPAPSERYSLSQNMPEILFEDQWLLVLHKPEGVLSVPGKSEEQSIYSLLRARYPQATGPLVVHRLDMATSDYCWLPRPKKYTGTYRPSLKTEASKKIYSPIGWYPSGRRRSYRSSHLSGLS